MTVKAITGVPSIRERPPSSASAVENGAPARWLVVFVVVHLGCQLLLLVPGISAVRIVVRTFAYGAGLILMASIPSKHMAKLPVRPVAIAVIAILCLEFFNPEGAGAVAGLAQVMLNLAIMAPIFWVPRLALTVQWVQRLITILWLFYTASAILGVLQAYFPGHFMPQLSSVVAAHGREHVAGLQIALASGERIFRPMGLTDVPGGAASGGLYAVLLGTGMLLLPKSPFAGARIAAAASMVAGMMCLYLCQVRSLLLMTGIGLIVLFFLSVLGGRITRTIGLVLALGALIPCGFIMAVSLGGRSVTARLATLTEADPSVVYYKHRGHFLEQTINEYLPRYPLGAGLGRWGMVGSYFGGANPLYVEIQWTAWLFDGGLLMIIVYFSAVLVVTWRSTRVALARYSKSDSALSLWGAVVVAYDVGAIALCFNYAVFIGNAGVEFWLINSALLCAAYRSQRALQARPLEAPRTIPA